MSQEKSTISKIWGVVSTALVVLVVLVAVFLMGSRVLGFRVFNVVSGSMEPTYSVGDLVYVKEVPAEEIKVGDPITFVLNEQLTVATHRVERIEQKEGELYFYTKGDANKDADKTPVHNKNVVGVVKFSIPLLGYVSDFVQNPPGMYIAIGLGIVLIIAVFLPDMIKSRKEKDVKAHTAEAVSMPFEETKEVTASVPQPSDDKSSDVKIDQENGKEE